MWYAERSVHPWTAGDRVSRGFGAARGTPARSRPENARAATTENNKRPAEFAESTAWNLKPGQTRWRKFGRTRNGVRWHKYGLWTEFCRARTAYCESGMVITKEYWIVPWNEKKNAVPRNCHVFLKIATNLISYQNISNQLYYMTQDILTCS
jgi:hypothetical protein